MKKQTFSIWVDRVFYLTGIIWLALLYAFPGSDSSGSIKMLGFVFLAFMFAEKILEFITVYRADVKGMSFTEAIVSMHAKRFNYPGKVWIHLIVSCIFITFIITRLFL